MNEQIQRSYREIDRSLDAMNTYQLNQKKQVEKTRMFEHRERQNLPLNSSTYQIGQFSKFAVARENSTLLLNKYIQNVIRQGAISHLKKLQEVMKIQEGLKVQSQQIQRELKTFLQYQNKQQLREIIRNPIQYYLTKINPNFLDNFDATQYINNFVDLAFQLGKYSLVQGKIIQKKKLNLNSYHKRGEDYYVPFSGNDKTFIKINKSGEHKFVYEFQNIFYSKSSLSNLDDEEKKKIIQTVYEFLKAKGIISDKDDISQKLSNLFEAVKK